MVIEHPAQVQHIEVVESDPVIRPLDNRDEPFHTGRHPHIQGEFLVILNALKKVCFLIWPLWFSVSRIRESDWCPHRGNKHDQAGTSSSHQGKSGE